MEGKENSALNSYYHRHHHTGNAVNSGGSNGLFVSPNHHHHQNHQQQQHHQQQNQHQHSHQHQQHQHNNAGHYSSTSPEPTPLIFPPHSVTGRSPFGSSPPPPPTAPSAPAPPAETVKRKRGRPRKYGTSETAQNSPSSNKKLSSSTSPPPSTSLPVSSSPRKKDSSSVSSPSSKKSQLLALGNAGQGFTPHVITVAAGEDVGQKIMSFMQQKKRAVCILSASGSISNASLRQSAIMGGNVTYEGRYEILSLSGSYLHTEIGGASSRTGGLSICLSGTDGRIVGGGVGGPLKAAGPVQVIVGSFVYNNQKEVLVDFETSKNKLPASMVGSAISSDHHHLYRLTDSL
ncbi:hypothetical protein C5167_043983 [Papaver somniferum]|uniref:AT-hook motif nuclear-localized protein n=1 Tax=Papaver somniferum TaxID=3469 RepID=A0A4Y7L9T9_PAPSO|nr:AT-hook motif nuclear-localized protein 14-like [Papaver somniferum]RZC81410.1 hypothetical protein C5167_043983 [Papaver somniferum]